MHSPASLGTFPPELLTVVFSFACTDTGYTGYALNLVCRTFHDVCVNTSRDIQSAAVCGTEKLELFLGMLRSREERKRKVDSLFLSHRGQVGWVEEQVPYPSEKSAIAARLMVEIMRTVLPGYLRILHTDCPTIWVPLTFTSPVILPHLIELSHVTTFFIPTSFCRLSDMYVAPNVERLCISGVQVGPMPGEESEALGDMLNHCALSDRLRLVYAYCKLSQSLKDIVVSYQPPFINLDGPDAGGNCLLPVTTLPSNYPPIVVDDIHMPTRLERVILENPPWVFPPEGIRLPISGPRQMSDVFWIIRQLLHRAFYAVASEAAEEGGIQEEEQDGRRRSLRVLPLSPDLRREDSQQRAEEEFARLKAEWLERTAGTGPGCWA